MRRLTLAAWVAAILFVGLFAGMAPTLAQQPSDELKSARQLATEFFKAGDYRQSLVFAEQALALVVREYGANHEQVAIATYGLGLTASRAGDDAKAADYLARTIRLRELVYGKSGPGVAEALDLYGAALMRLGRLEEAEIAFRRALKLRQDILGMEHAYQAESTANLGSVALARGKFSEALPLFRKAINLLSSQKTDFVFAQKVLNKGLKRHRSAFVGLARAVWHGADALGIPKQAAFDEAFRGAQDAWRTSAAEAIARMTARLGTASTPLGRDVSRMQKLADEIVSLNEEDIRELERWSAVQRADPDYSQAADELRTASAKRFSAGMPNVKRQRALTNELTNLVKRCPPGQKKAGCAGSLKRIQEIGAELGKLAKASNSGNAATLAIMERLRAAEQKLPGYAAFSKAREARVKRSSELGITRRALRKKIIKAYPAYAALADPEPLSGGQVGQLLATDEALITMLVGRTKSFVWVITSARMSWAQIDIGERQLTEEVTALRRGLDPLAATEGGEQPAFDFARAHRLYAILFGKIEQHIKDKRHLIVIPSGPLTSLPPQVLITSKPTAGSTSEQTVKQSDWLIRRHALSVLPSVQSLAALRRLQRTAKSRKPFIGIGDPVLKGEPSQGQGNSRGKQQRATLPARFYTRGLANVRAVRALAPLPDTADELRAIARVLGASQNDVLLGKVASETAVKARSLTEYRIVHFATHGLVAGDLSGLNEPALVLTPPEQASEQDDGLLTASEIATLALDADWVVLSACNTAAGEAVGAEALSGLARAFFFSGARALLVSHWAVFSDAAVQLTTETFATLKRAPKLGRAEALRRSMVRLIEQGQPPAYWAPFVIVGEGGKPARG